MTELALETLLEATLFGSGKSMSVSELSESLGYEDDEIIDSLGALQATMKRRRGGALRLVELLGQKAYDYVRELAQYGMIQRRREGNTRRLTTTRRFSEAFGCPHTDLRKVRKWFREQVTDAGLFDGMEEVDALQEVGEDGLIQATLPLEEE